MQFSGLVLGKFYPGVHGVVVPPRSISNSGVKRSSGDDSWGEAPCENSSMPGKTFLSSKVQFSPATMNVYGNLIKPPKRVAFLLVETAACNR